MEKKHSFFSEVVRGLSPGKSRSNSPNSRSVSPLRLLRRNKQQSQPQNDQVMARSGSLRPVGETLAPLMEGPNTEGFEGEGKKEGWSGLQNWMRGQLHRAPSVSGYKRSDLQLLLGVLGAPLAPVRVSSDPLPHLSIKNIPIESSSAQYILQQYIAASGGAKFQSSIRNAYAMGKVKMLACEYETATKLMKNRNASKAAETGGFVLWQMMPDMWYVELAVGGSKVHAGSNGKIVWRHTPWLGAHAAKGPVRPLRRALQGLDPRTTASMFSDARCIGEKQINGEDCFILKLCADPSTLKARSDGPAEIIRHVLFGYFSQRTGLLVLMEDSHLTRIQSTGSDAVYWETTINSFLEDYRSVDGMMIAHSGRSIVTLFRFGETAMSHTKTRMEEAWTIEEVEFNVPGLSMDCFIPPADIMCGSVSEASELPQEERGKSMAGSNRNKVAALEKSQEKPDNIIWRVEV